MKSNLVLALFLALLMGGTVRDVRAQTANCPLRAGALFDPKAPPGTPNDDVPVEHIIVLMQENRSFDHYFGLLNKYGYDEEVDGLTADMANPDLQGNPIPVYTESRYCVQDTSHNWNAAHRQYNNGRNDGFVVTNADAPDDGRRAMGFYTGEDIPYYYALANTFATGDRYFSSLLGPTFPNRFYLLTGTSFGHIRNNFPTSLDQFSQPTIFDLLNTYQITWKYYFSDAPAVGLFLPVVLRNLDKFAHVLQYYDDVARGRLPQVVFIDPFFLFSDEHPPHNIQIGQAFVATIIDALIRSPLWPQSAFFLTYDENGGLFDHVPPPPACVPDDIAPMLQPGDTPARFDRYGFRVPVLVVSPYAKRHYVSHEVYDHTSIIRFIEMKWNLPALTNRDANANPMLDFFDFKNPQVPVPRLPPAEIDGERLVAQCFQQDSEDAENQQASGLGTLLPTDVYWRGFSSWFYYRQQPNAP
jgi:phospholipase C